MRTTSLLRIAGVCGIVGGLGLVTLFVSPGGCLGDACDSRPLPGTAPGQVPWALTTTALLVAAAAGLFVAAGRGMPVRRFGVAAALCAAGGVLFAVAAGITASRTGGESWLMPVFVFPALLLLTAALIVVGVVLLRADVVPRRMAVAMIVAAALLPLFHQQTPANFIPVLLGLAWAMVGTHLLLRGGRHASPVDQSRPRAML